MATASDDEAEMQRIMGFGNFQGTKRTPKHHDLPTGRAKGKAPVFTGANSQPVIQRQHHSVPASEPAQSHQSIPDAIFHPEIPSLSVKQDKHDPAHSLAPVADTVNSEGPTPARKSDGDNIVSEHHHLQDANYALPVSYLPQKSSATTLPNRLPSQHGGHHQRDPNAIGWTNTVTGFSYTNAQLDSLAQGSETITKIDNNGKEYKVPLYFMPCFVEDDPWAALKAKPKPRHQPTKGPTAGSRSWR